MAKRDKNPNNNAQWAQNLQLRKRELRDKSYQPIHRLAYQILPAHTIVISIGIGGDIKGDIIPKGVDFWNKQIEGFRSGIGRGLFTRGAIDLEAEVDDTLVPIDQVLQQIYEVIIRPVAAHLPEKGSPLLIEPFGALWQIPFHLLRSSDDTYLGDQYLISYAPSFDIFEQIQKERVLPIRSEDTFLFGGLGKGQQIGDFNFYELPNAEAEVSTIVRDILHLPDENLVIGTECTKDGIQKRMSGSRILHLSAHGEANLEHPDKSFIAFSGDTPESAFLTANEIAHDVNLLGCEMVVLSACKSGLGKVMSEGMIGLARAFLIAGARSVIVSLWSVEDASTKLLMEQFYLNLIKTQGQKAAALQQAMQTVQTMDGRAHPRCWAPFILIGAQDCDWQVGTMHEGAS